MSKAHQNLLKLSQSWTVSFTWPCFFHGKHNKSSAPGFTPLKPLTNFGTSSCGPAWRPLTTIHDNNNQQTRSTEISLKLIKNIYKTPTANIIHNGERLDAFPKSNTRKDNPSLITLIEHYTRSPSLCNKQRKEEKGIWIAKVKIKLSLPQMTWGLCAQRINNNKSSWN